MSRPNPYRIEAGLVAIRVLQNAQRRTSIRNIGIYLGLPWPGQAQRVVENLVRSGAVKRVNGKLRIVGASA